MESRLGQFVRLYFDILANIEVTECCVEVVCDDKWNKKSTIFDYILNGVNRGAP